MRFVVLDVLFRRLQRFIVSVERIADNLIYILLHRNACFVCAVLQQFCPLHFIAGKSAVRFARFINRILRNCLRAGHTVTEPRLRLSALRQIHARRQSVRHLSVFRSVEHVRERIHFTGHTAVSVNIHYVRCPDLVKRTLIVRRALFTRIHRVRRSRVAIRQCKPLCRRECLRRVRVQAIVHLLRRPHIRVCVMDRGGCLSRCSTVSPVCHSSRKAACALHNACQCNAALRTVPKLLRRCVLCVLVIGCTLEVRIYQRACRFLYALTENIKCATEHAASGVDCALVQSGNTAEHLLRADLG